MNPAVDFIQCEDVNINCGNHLRIRILRFTEAHFAQVSRSWLSTWYCTRQFRVALLFSQ